MSTILTEHVRHFGREALPSDAVLHELRRLLRRQMRRRGLLAGSPAFLGYPDVRRWGDEGAFDDIVSDCYVEALARRIVSLQNQLGHAESIDALIVHNINHFLAERQREHNPIGYAVFQNVRAAVRLAIEDGWLLREAQPGRSWSASVLRFVDHAARPRIPLEALAGEVGREPGLNEIAYRLASCSQAAQEWLLGLLQHLHEHRPDAIRLGDLVRVLEEVAREAWARAAPPPSDVVRERGEDDLVQLVRVVRPDTTLEDQEQAQALLARVREAVAGLPQQDRVRDRRLRVFEEVVRQLQERPGETIRQVEIAQALGINQVTLHHDVEAIREVVARVVRGNS